MAEIKKVSIKAGEHEFELSIEEAKSLRDILTQTFPVEVFKPYPPMIIEKHVPVWPTYPRPYYGWDVWCGGNTGETLCLSTSR